MLALSLLLNIVVDNDVFNVVQVEQRGVGQVGSWWKENVNLGSDALGAVPDVELKEALKISRSSQGDQVLKGLK